jgi:hypothetical protein
MATGVPFDEVAKRRIIAQMAEGSSLAYASESSGFSVSTVRRHMRENPEFAQAVTDAVQRADGKVQKKLYDTILEEKSIPGMFRWLEARQAAEFGQKKLVVNQHVGPGGGPVQVAIATTDQLRELISDPETRAQMLDTVRQLPMIEATAREHD